MSAGLGAQGRDQNLHPCSHVEVVTTQSQVGKPLACHATTPEMVGDDLVLPVCPSVLSSRSSARCSSPPAVDVFPPVSVGDFFAQHAVEKGRSIRRGSVNLVLKRGVSSRVSGQVAALRQQSYWFFVQLFQ